MNFGDEIFQTAENPLTYLASCAPSMEGNSPSSSSSSPCSNDSVSAASETPAAYLYLRSKGNPGPWIQNNPIASHLLVKHLLLDFSGINDEEEDIDDTIDHLTQLTHLTIRRAKTLKSMPNSMLNLHNLQFFKFSNCYFQELPANLEVLEMGLTHLKLDQCPCIETLPESIATLSSLTCLLLYGCYALAELPASLGQLGSLRHFSLESCHILQSLPDSASNLLNLETLYIKDCYSLAELPASLGKLRSLKHFSLERCYRLRFLPDTMSVLNGLETLCIKCCDSLKELPASLGLLKSLKHLLLVDCNSLQSLPDSASNLLNLEKLHIENCPSITELPKGLIKLRRLLITLGLCSEGQVANLKDSVNLEILNVVSGYSSSKIPIYIANLKQFSKLQILSFRSRDYEFVVKFPDTFEGLDELILLDIQDTKANYLPWSIMKLPKLKYLMLPWAFRLETLPFDLNDSILISVKERCIRKIWKKFKQEIGISPFLFAQDKYPPSIAPPGYLSFQGNFGQWFKDNHESCCLVKMLELQLELPEYSYFDDPQWSIKELPNLTHLFVTYGNGWVKNCVPHTIKDLKHLCLKWCGFYSKAVSLLRLSNLHTLDLIVKKIPSNLNLPGNLRHLSIHSEILTSLSDSIAKLSKLHTFELCVNTAYDIPSLPPLNIITLRINRIVNSLPTSLRRLEILHNERDCFDKRCDGIRLCLSQLVNLETLSLTCYIMKSLPSMEGLHKLQVLLLKDCFALKELKPDVEQLIKLKTLDISGTRIEYLPDSIMSLSKLQRLILPRCFRQKLRGKLEEVSIVDDTDDRYYEHMGYYDTDFDAISDFSSKGNDDEVGSIEGVDKAFTVDSVQGVMDEQPCELDGVVTQVAGVSRATMKRKETEHRVIWLPSKKGKQCHTCKENGEPNIDSPVGHGHKLEVSEGTAATMANVEKSPLELVKESHMGVPQRKEVHSDGANKSNIAQLNGSCCSFDFVKASYDGDSVRIDISLTSSFDQLNESICKKFNLEVNKFKIKYLDEDKEWLLMTSVSELNHALVHTSSSGMKFVRLSITDKKNVNSGQA